MGWRGRFEEMSETHDLLSADVVITLARGCGLDGREELEDTLDEYLHDNLGYEDLISNRNPLELDTTVVCWVPHGETEEVGELLNALMADFTRQEPGAAGCRIDGKACENFKKWTMPLTQPQRLAF